MSNPRSNRNAICEKNPWVSRSMGVHKSKIEAANKAAKEHGCRHRYNDQGFVVATSRAARNDAMKFHGMGDRDGGYGDHTG